MFNIGGGELLVILLIALIVLGPQRLPDAARTVGRVMSEVRKLSAGFQREVRDAFEEADTGRTSDRREWRERERRPLEPAAEGAVTGDIDPHVGDALDEVTAAAEEPWPGEAAAPGEPGRAAERREGPGASDAPSIRAVPNDARPDQDGAGGERAAS